MKAYAGLDIWLHAFLLDISCKFYGLADSAPGKEPTFGANVAHWTEGWEGPRTDLDDRGNRNVINTSEIKL
jgi:hypothetical protein